MTTVDEAIDLALGYLEPVNRPKYNRLTSGVSTSADELVLDFEIANVGNGSVVGVDTELCLVLDANPSTRTLTVHRGWRSTAATHATGDVVEMRPRYSRAGLLAAMRAEILSWPKDLFRVGPVVPIVTDTTTTAYDIDLTDVTAVLGISAGAEDGSVDVRPSWLLAGAWRVDRVVDSAVFPSGSALVIDRRLAGRNLSVVVALPFDLSVFDGDTALEGQVGLAESMIDLAAVGAAARLVQETPRSQLVVTDSQMSEQVPAGLLMQTRQDLRRQRQERLADEIIKLLHDWPARG